MMSGEKQKKINALQMKSGTFDIRIKTFEKCRREKYYAEFCLQIRDVSRKWKAVRGKLDYFYLLVVKYMIFVMVFT